MPVNEPLLRASIEYIESNPEEWNQRTYIADKFPATVERPSSCGTTRCLAGTAIMLHTGLAQEEEQVRHVTRDNNTEFFQYGMEILGLSYDEAEGIFYHYTDDLDSLKERITDLTGVEFKTDGA